VQSFEATLMKKRLADAKTVKEVEERLAELKRSGGRKPSLAR
jgi:hypothetical protein